MDEILTERLRWRPMRPDDTDLYLAVMSDFEVVRMLGTWPWPPDRDEVARRCANPPEGPGFLGPIFVGDQMIGGMGVHDGGIGYAFGRAYWGKGYATEMGRAMITRAFARYDWDEIVADVWADNPASARVLQKLGFEKRGRTIEYSTARKAEVPSLRFALKRPSPLSGT